MTEHAYQDFPEPSAQPPKPTELTVIEGGRQSETALGPYKVRLGELNERFLPMLITHGDQVLGQGGASLSEDGKTIIIDQFGFEDGVDQTQAYEDVVYNMVANHQIQQVDLFPQTAEEMAERINMSVPPGWIKTTFEDPAESQFNIRFEKREVTDEMWVEAAKLFARNTRGMANDTNRVYPPWMRNQH